MTTIAVSLPEDLKSFVEFEANQGGYADAGEYVRDVLRALWKQKAKAGLEAKLTASIESRPAIEVTPKFWEYLKSRVSKRLLDGGIQ